MDALRNRLSSSFAWVGVSVGLLALAAMGAQGWGPPCLFHSITGKYCPGCGMMRALGGLLRGDWVGACRMNLLFTVSFVLFLPLAVNNLWRGRTLFALPPYLCRRSVLIAIGATVLLFTVARNLPWHPFTCLAPH